ncbi:MAG: hypothetical protein ABI775_01045 [Pseudonocardiales bacterium]
MQPRRLIRRRDLNRLLHVTASSAALASNITYNFSVLNPDADPLAMDWAGNCGNLGRNGFFLQPGQPSSAALGPLPMQVIFHHATSTPETIKGVYLMFGAERNDTHAALTVTSASPNAIARGTLTRLLLQPPIRATSS